MREKRPAPDRQQPRRRDPGQIGQEATLTAPQALMLDALRTAVDSDIARGIPDWHAKAHPRQLAKIRWPDSDGWNHVSNRGSTPAGGAMGATMPMKAATVLWRLHPHFASSDFASGGWTITPAGRRWLDAHEGFVAKAKAREAAAGPRPARNTRRVRNA